MKPKILTLTFFAICSVMIAQTVPPNWQSLYNQLEIKLHFIDSTMNEKWDGDKYCTNYCTNLLIASSNKGPELLGDSVLHRVWLTLNTLDSLGIKAIDLTVNYPILVDSFPRSNEYLEFYKTVAGMIKNRGYKLIIGVQSAFRDEVFGKLPVDTFYIGMTSQRYKEEKAQMLQTVVDSLKPDYITLEMEPSTQEMNFADVGLIFSIDSVMNYLDYFLTNVNFNNTKIGAGSGTWDGLEFIENISLIPEIDYIDFHIYPIVDDFFIENVFIIDSIAKQNNKELVIGESWLYKANGSDFTNYEPYQLFARDVFSFWQPLDSLPENMLSNLDGDWSSLWIPSGKTQ